MEITLLIMAAGMGSRYGGLKQLDIIGPSGETIMDYSVYDAIEAGFTKIVFVIRKSFENEFKAAFINKLENKIKVCLAYQEINDIPIAMDINENRTKPWGTAHAIWVARLQINEPFAVINADDFYGKDAFITMANFLKTVNTSGNNYYSMCGYRLKNTLSDHGSVSRGVCKIDHQSFLVEVTENTDIKLDNNGVVVSIRGVDKIAELSGEEVVSMNFWGFTQGIFNHIEQFFIDFLKTHGNETKSEIYIPFIIDQLIKEDLVKTEVLECDAKWFGVTFKEDKVKASKNINQLIGKGVYPNNLWP